MLQAARGIQAMRCISQNTRLIAQPKPGHQQATAKRFDGLLEQVGEGLWSTSFSDTHQ
jgi:hypothetical protein